MLHDRDLEGGAARPGEGEPYDPTQGAGTPAWQQARAMGKRMMEREARSRRN